MKVEGVVKKKALVEQLCVSSVYSTRRFLNSSCLGLSLHWGCRCGSQSGSLTWPTLLIIITLSINLLYLVITVVKVFFLYN